ncbi:DUF559 domain-containing protein [Herbiconiux sp. 11R-BC]|uniref:endonuclease domain-containing protein n=1 Tax=Herbiconiux sp. 11R-BC TaxID=3111637 RepID=UPI003BFEB84D
MVHRPSWARPSRSAVDDIAVALACATVCQPQLDAIVTLDSALALGLVSPSSLADVLAPLPAKYRAYLGLVDPASQSGLETKARVRLQGRGLRTRSQVEIPGVGHVDLLIGERLVLELDGYAWHSKKKDFNEDRRRGLELARLGYTLLRLSYEQVTYSWDACETTILDLVRRREHLWPRGAARTE